jgi:drug/metabolite transporter (DMT)-like permease
MHQLIRPSLARYRALHPSRRAVVLMLASVVCFSILETTGKYLSQYYPVLEVVWARYTVHVVLMLIFLAPRLGRSLVRTRQPGGQLVRATLLLGSTVCNLFALSRLPLAEVKAISFVSPLLVTMFAVWLLHEKVSLSKWIAVIVGFLGILFIVRPGSHMVSWAASLALGNALCYSLYQIMTRRFSEDENPLTTLFYSALVGCVVLSFMAPWIWVWPAAGHIGFFLLIGVAGALGHFMLIKALEIERASVLSPLGYTQLIWVTLLGFLIFGQLPDGHAVVGMAIIVGSGLYVAWGHRARRNEEPDSAIE